VNADKRKERKVILEMNNLFTDDTPPPTGERFDTVLAHRNLVVERIVSSARITPGEYVQAQDEWVVLLRGQATLDVAGRQMAMTSGDHVFLPSGTPHTVKSVSQGAMWLAVHLHPQTP
jgi:cupin 2 domain-containing protein